MRRRAHGLCATGCEHRGCSVKRTASPGRQSRTGRPSAATVKGGDRKRCTAQPRLALLALVCVLAAGGTPAPNSPLRQLRFSPNGRYILAQDSSEIAVLTAQPLAVVFRIPAGEASDAQFTPDSLQIVFVNSGTRTDPEPVLHVRSWPRVEHWTIADQTHAESPEMRGSACRAQELSPDGGTLACTDAQGTLRILDTASGETVFQESQFVRLIPLYSHLPDGAVDLPSGNFLGDLGQSSIDFSPDGRFLIARPSGGHGKPLAWDLNQKSTVDLKGKVREIAGGSCVFLAPHRLLVPAPLYQASHGVVTAKLTAFPSSETLAKLKLPAGHLFRAADPAFVLIRPFGRGAWWNPNATRVAAADVRTGQVIISDTPALDVLGRYYVAEPSAGMVGLYERGKGLRATLAVHER